MTQLQFDPLSADEVAQKLEQSLLALVADCRALTPAQWDFSQEGANQWSPAQIVEHLAVIELGIHIKVKGALATADPNGKEANPGATRLLRMLSRRGPIRVQAPDFAQPTGRFGDGATALDSLCNARSANIRLSATAQAALPKIVMPHPFLGPMDGWQWMMFLGAHLERHHAQMKEYLAAISAAQ